VTVWKFTLDFPAETQRIPMPAGAQVLHVAFQDGHFRMWALVDPAADTEERWFAVVGTGQDVPAGGQHVGSVGWMRGGFWWHVFEVQP
jgi:hypothetical protein